MNYQQEFHPPQTETQFSSFKQQKYIEQMDDLLEQISQIKIDFGELIKLDDLPGSLNGKKKILFIKNL